MCEPEAFYRVHPKRATEEPTTMIEPRQAAQSESTRLAEARERAAERVRRQRDILRPLGWAVIVVVATGAAGGDPHPGLQGRALGMTLALCAFAGTLVRASGRSFPERGHAFQAAIIAAMGAAGVVLVALQPQGTTELAGGAAVWMAITRLQMREGMLMGAAVAAALDAAGVAAGSSSAAILATTLLLALLGLVAYFIKQARASQDRAELLLAQLEDARDEQTQAAAIAERSRIAGELHDILAHSLSGAAIQLEAARKLAEREQTTSPMRAAIDRAGQLVRDGLANARQAVGALRGEELPGVAQLESLVSSFNADMDVDVTLVIEGSTRPLPAETSLALYRGAQEALTNVARYAPGASTDVVLRYGADRTALTIEDRLPPGAPPLAGKGLTGVGGGRGLAGLRERIECIGGSLSAGATESGWRVDLVVPT
jgi:signal transduction histidine kinase